MATNLNIYGEGAGAGVTATATVPAGHVYKVTKMTGDIAGAGYIYIRINAANVYSMYFWAAGNQSEDNLTLIATAGQVIDCNEVGGGVNRAALTGYDQLTAV